jgi:hypothetical protein
MSDSTVGSTLATGGSTTEQVKDQVREKAQVAQDKAGGALGQARSRLRDQVDQRSTQAGDQIHSTAQDVRNVAEQLRNQGKDGPARVAEQVADRAESFGTYLRDADGERLLRDVEDFARRQPMLVAAAGLALGFAASRFLKASSSRRYESSDGDGYAGRTYGPGAYGTTSPYSTVTSYEPGAYDTATGYQTETRYETEVPVTEAPVAGANDDRRS